MPEGFFVIAGPQASGKSTSMKYLHSKYSSGQVPDNGEHYSLSVLQEMRQIVIHKYNISGAIFMERGEEREIIESDLGRMDRILMDGDDRVFLDECNVFTLCHAQAHGIGFESYYRDYVDRLARLRAGVVFLDVSPEVSWQRRMPRYEERVQEFPSGERGKIMGMYRDYLFTLKPLLDDMYDRLQLPKRKIRNEGMMETSIIGVSSAFEEMSRESGITLYKRF